MPTTPAIVAFERIPTTSVTAKVTYAFGNSGDKPSIDGSDVNDQSEFASQADSSVAIAVTVQKLKRDLSPFIIGNFGSAR